MSESGRYGSSSSSSSTTRRPAGGPPTTQLNGVDFAFLGDVRRYPKLHACLNEQRKQHISRAVRQHPIFRELGDSVHGVAAQIDASIDYGLGSGCGFVAMVAPELPARTMISNTHSLECGVSLYKFSLQSQQEGVPSHLHDKAKAVVQQLFAAATARCIDRDGSEAPMRPPLDADNLSDEGSYTLPEERITIWSQKESIRRFLEASNIGPSTSDTLNGISTDSLFRQGLYVPPVQMGYTDGAACRYGVYALEERSENTFTFVLMVDGGSLLSELVLRNQCLVEGGSLFQRRHDFEAVREYSDLARDAQAYVIMSWMRRLAEGELQNTCQHWSLQLPETKFLREWAHQMFFCEPFAINHFNSLMVGSEALGLGRSSMCSPGVLQLHKSFQNKHNLATRSSGQSSSSSSSSPLPDVPVSSAPGSSVALPPTSSILSGKLSQAQARKQLREMEEVKTSKDFRPDGSLRPQLSGGPGSSSSGNAGAAAARSMFFFQQCTAVNASSGGLVVLDPCTQQMQLFVAKYNVGRVDYDVLRHGPDALTLAGVVAVDKKHEMLPNLELGQMQGAFPRFFPTGRDLSTESQLRTFPSMDPHNVQLSHSVLSDGTEYLSGAPVMQPLVQRADSVFCSVAVYRFSCLGLYSDCSEDSKTRREERIPWARALYQFYQEESEFEANLKTETRERKNFLTSCIAHLCACPTVRSDFFPGDHYTLRTSPEFLAELVAANDPSLKDSIVKHFVDGSLIPRRLWEIIGDETLQQIPVLPGTLSVEAMYRAVASWRQ